MSQKVIQQYKFIFKKSIHTERVSMTKEWFYTKEKNHKKNIVIVQFLAWMFTCTYIQNGNIRDKLNK